MGELALVFVVWGLAAVVLLVVAANILVFCVNRIFGCRDDTLDTK